MILLSALHEIGGTLHYTGSCLGQSIWHPRSSITHCSASLSKPESSAPWWGLAAMTLVGGIGLTVGEIYDIVSLTEISRTLADGGVFLLFGRGHMVYTQNRKK